MNQQIEGQGGNETKVTNSVPTEDRRLTDDETEAVSGGGWWDDGPMPDWAKKAHDERNKK